MSKSVYLLVSVSLVVVGAIATDLLSMPLLKLLTFMSDLGGIIGGACALIALYQWKKQTDYSKTIETIESLESVRMYANSLVSQRYTLLLILENPDKLSEDMLAQSLFSLTQDYSERLGKLADFKEEFYVKVRLLEIINKDKNYHELKMDLHYPIRKLFLIKFEIGQREKVIETYQHLEEIEKELLKAISALRSYLEKKLN